MSALCFLLLIIFSFITLVISQYLSSQCPFKPGYDRCIDYRDSFTNSTLKSNGIRELKYTAFCSCDESCSYYDNCCVDAVRKVIKRTKPECAEINFLSSYYFVVQKCSLKWSNKIIQNLCEMNVNVSNSFYFTFNTINNQLKRNTSNGLTYDYEVLVFSEVTNTLYKNIFCSICNDDYETIVKFDYAIFCTENKFRVANTRKNWPITMEEFIENAIFNHDQYRWEIQIENVKLACELRNPKFSDYSKKSIRKCELSINDCPATWTNRTVHNLCKAYSSSVYVNHRKYRNKHCATCNNESEPFGCIKPSPLPAAGVPPSIRNLLDLRMDTNIFDSKLKSRCKLNDGKIFNPITRECIEFGCSSKFIKDHKTGKCIPKNDTLNTSAITGIRRDCKTIKLKRSEFIAINETLIYLNYTDKFYDDKNFEHYDKDRILICFDDNFINSPIPDSNVEKILSLLCLILSIISLIAHLIIYTLLPKLRTISGKSLMSLSLSLLLAHVSFISLGFVRTGTKNPPCVIIAVSAQFFYLASFFWMNVLSYDIWRLLGQLKRNHGNSSKRFIHYSIYAWCMPAIVIFVALVNNYLLPSNDFQPLYGLRTCWISQRNALLLFFIAPLCLLLMMNISFFASTMRKLNETKENSHSVQKADKITFQLYLKISMIMGFTWIFGALAAFNNNHFLWYPFVIFNGLQGVFIFFSFSFKKQIYTDIHEKLSEYSRSSSQITATELSNVR